MRDLWVRLLVDQLDFYMKGHLRPRLVGLSDDEYFWEPVANCSSVRPAADGAWAMDGHSPYPKPDQPPVTTIGWRLAHIAVSNIGTRASAFFGDGTTPSDADMFDERHRPSRFGVPPPKLSLCWTTCTGGGESA